MSQEKVDKYKHDKANRKSIMAREKRMHILECGAVIVVCVAIVAWIGVSLVRSIYSSATEDTETTQTEVNMDSINAYLTELNSDDASDETDATEEGASEETTSGDETAEDTSDESTEE